MSLPPNKVTLFLKWFCLICGNVATECGQNPMGSLFLFFILKSTFTFLMWQLIILLDDISVFNNLMVHWTSNLYLCWHFGPAKGLLQSVAAHYSMLPMATTEYKIHESNTSERFPAASELISLFSFLRRSIIVHLNSSRYVYKQVVICIDSYSFFCM